MQCLRCNSPVNDPFINEHEYRYVCNVCGYYSIRYIDCFVDDHPIYYQKQQSPLGVVVTDKGNIQYFTYSGRANLLENNISYGYTYFEKNKWYYFDTQTKFISNINEVYEKII